MNATLRVWGALMQPLCLSFRDQEFCNLSYSSLPVTARGTLTNSGRPSAKAPAYSLHAFPCADGPHCTHMIMLQRLHLSSGLRVFLEKTEHREIRKIKTCGQENPEPSGFCTTVGGTTDVTVSSPLLYLAGPGVGTNTTSVSCTQALGAGILRANSKARA